MWNAKIKKYNGEVELNLPHAKGKYHSYDLVADNGVTFTKLVAIKIPEEYDYVPMKITAWRSKDAKGKTVTEIQVKPDLDQIKAMTNL